MKRNLDILKSLFLLHDAQKCHQVNHKMNFLNLFYVKYFVNKNLLNENYAKKSFVEEFQSDQNENYICISHFLH